MAHIDSISPVPLDVEGVREQIAASSFDETLELFTYLNAQTQAHIEALKVAGMHLISYAR